VDSGQTLDGRLSGQPDTTGRKEVACVPKNSRFRQTRRASSSRSITLATILQKGNSDPFDTFPVSIDPKVNDLMSFCRDYLPPSPSSLEPRSGAKPSTVPRDWQICVAALHDQCIAYGYLSRYAAVMASMTHDSDLAMRALAYRNQSSALLRVRLATEPVLSNVRTFWSVSGLLSAEIALNDPCGAAVHANFLALWFQAQKDGEVNLDLLHEALFHEVQRTAISLTRTFFDVDKWIPEQYQTKWKEISDSLPLSSRAASRALDPSVGNPRLREILIELRELLEALKLNIMNPTSASPSVFGLISSHCLVCELQLLNYYLDICAQLPMVQRPEDPAGGSTNDANIEAYTSLAALVFFTANPNILIELQRAMSQSEAGTRPYSRLRLWALYVGATAEQAQVRPNPQLGSSAGPTWFNVRFAEQAKRMGLLSKPEIENVLRGFLYTELDQQFRSH